ncbi:MAG: AraC family transcriptional regulator [Ekhidna sp.]|nr:AraC family transcriptional regulator [Ekhidna sp.]
MYTQKTYLKDDFAVVDSVVSIKKRETARKVLVPDNMAEIFIPVSGRCQIKPFDSIRHTTLHLDRSCFLMPRRRGVELLLDEDAECLVIKVSPLFARGIAERLDQLAIGIYDLRVSEFPRRAINRFYLEDDLWAINEWVSNAFFEELGLFEYNSTILDSIDQIKQRNGNVSVKEIYSSLQVSKSKLEQHFNREIGLTPKEFCMIEKINCFIKLYLEGNGHSLTELTYLCGYYDQSHLIKDFKYFLNTSPKRFLKALEGMIVN